jgi:hypothetical protein
MAKMAHLEDRRNRFTVARYSTLSDAHNIRRPMNLNTKPHHDTEDLRSDESNTGTILHRLGAATVGTLSITTIIVLAAVAFLAFLWHSNADNALWHGIVAYQWLARTVTISSFVLRSAVDLQIGIATAMLAAIVLESGYPLLRYAPHLSTARASKPKPRTLLFPAWRSIKSNTSSKHVAITIGLSILCCSALLLQFSS